MRRTKLIQTVLLCGILIIGVLACSGCSASESTSQTETEIDDSHLVDKNVADTLLDPKSYVLYGSATFLPISVELIKNGYDSNYTNTVFVEYVKTSDKTIWIQSFKDYKRDYCGSGIGESMTQAFGADGKPEIYDGDLDELMENFGVKEKN